MVNLLSDVLVLFPEPCGPSQQPSARVGFLLTETFVFGVEYRTILERKRRHPVLVSQEAVDTRLPRVEGRRKFRSDQLKLLNPEKIDRGFTRRPEAETGREDC